MTPEQENLMFDLLKLEDLMKSLGPPVPREFRIHPLDLEELKRTVPRHYPAPGQANSFMGVDLVVDEKAPRMPRKR